MNRIVVDADVRLNRISRHVYGHFAEHLGRCIYEGIWVGEGSSIDNVRGIRQDTVQALRKLKVPNLRWPGGCFADEYHWRDGVGPRDQRQPMVNTHWGGVTDTNEFGTHEFLDLCEQLGAEPYICGNVGSGTVQEMAEWVEYLTFSGESRIANLRRSNGRQDPWKIRYWGVGNENWGCGGKMRPEYYADVYRRYSTYCRNFSGNSLYRIACGPREADYHWTEVLMQEAAPMMDGLSLHYYTSERLPDGNRTGSATQFDESDWFTYMKKALYMEELVTRHSAIMDQYDADRRVALVVDEWGTWYEPEPGTHPRFLYQQNTVRDALVAGLTLNVFNRHSDRVRIANLAQTVNVLQAVILTDGPRLLLTPTYHVFEMYAVHHDSWAVPIHVDTERYRNGGQDVPAIDASASLDDGGNVHLTVCNTDPVRDIDIRIDIRGKHVGHCEARVLAGEALNAHNTFDRPDAVKPVALDTGIPHDGELVFSIPAHSVCALALN